jgi:hypothetical protein
MTQRPTQNNWKTKKGATACSLNNSRNVGTGISNLDKLKKKNINTYASKT